MHRSFFRLLIVIPVLLLNVACTSNPLKEPTRVHVPQGITQEQVADAVNATLLGRSWAINSERPGLINSTLYIREHTATINALVNDLRVKVSGMAFR